MRGAGPVPGPERPRRTEGREVSRGGPFYVPPRSLDSSRIATCARELGVHPVVASILLRRGYAEREAAERFLEPRLADLPTPEGMADYDAAVARIAQAVEQGERVGIFGDYDVDGITSAAVLADFLRELGVAGRVRLASRSQGYGLHPADVRALKEQGCGMLVSCDVGTSDLEAAEEAARLGMDLVVVDHHKTAESLPRAVALVNHSRRDDRFDGGALATVGLVFYLVSGVRRALAARRSPERLPDPRGLLDLVAVGTVADVVPLVAANRILVRRGLELLGRTRRPGLRALLRAAKVAAPVRARDVAFRIAPRLNAAGRLGSARPAFELLLTRDEERARELAGQLEGLNNERRSHQEQVFEAACEQVAWGQAGEHVLVVDGMGWHPGVVGIVAAKLVERYGRPAVVVSLEEGEEVGRGSCRSDGRLDMYECLSRVSEHLEGFGGHSAAAGLVVRRDRLAALRAALNAVAEEMLGGLPERVREADAEVAVSDLDSRLLQEMERLEPFGPENPEPLLYLQQVQVLDVRTMGSAHLRLRLGDPSRQVTAVAFSQADRAPEAGARIDVIFSLEWDHYAGPGAVRLNILQMSAGE